MSTPSPSHQARARVATLHMKLMFYSLSLWPIPIYLPFSSYFPSLLLLLLFFILCLSALSLFSSSSSFFPCHSLLSLFPHPSPPLYIPPPLPYTLIFLFWWPLISLAYTIQQIPFSFWHYSYLQEPVTLQHNDDIVSFKGIIRCERLGCLRWCLQCILKNRSPLCIPKYWSVPW